MTENIWFWVVMIAVAMVSFLYGRWRGIQEFDRAMVEAGKLPPREDDDFNMQNPFDE